MNRKNESQEKKKKKASILFSPNARIIPNLTEPEKKHCMILTQTT